MSETMSGLHHVTATAGPAQSNLDFHTGPLGQRLVKRTVNFEDPGTYHLYYGDRSGRPGRLLTAFPVPGARAGRVGTGAAEALAYGVAGGTLEAWAEALGAAGVVVAAPVLRFGARVSALADPDGLRIELVEVEAGARPEDGNVAAGGLHSVTLRLAETGPTARFLGQVFGYREVGRVAEADGERVRFAASGGGPGAVVDLVRRPGTPRARRGAGTIHHVAFRAASAAEQRAWRARLTAAGMEVTEILDRRYFGSLYFREPGGVLFEIATDGPGFTVDEPAEALGGRLCLPPRHEPERTAIEAGLPPLSVPGP